MALGLTVDMHPLAYWRYCARISQVELARRAGIHPVTLARIERAGAEPGVRVAIRLAEGVGVAVEDVWSGDGALPARFVEHRRERLRYAIENRRDKGAGLAHLAAWLNEGERS